MRFTVIPDSSEKQLIHLLYGVSRLCLSVKNKTKREREREREREGRIEKGEERRATTSRGNEISAGTTYESGIPFHSFVLSYFHGMQQAFTVSRLLFPFIPTLLSPFYLFRREEITFRPVLVRRPR